MSLRSRRASLVLIVLAASSCLLPDTGELRGGVAIVDAGDAGALDGAADSGDASTDPCVEAGLVAFYPFDETGSIAHNCVPGGSALDAILSNASLVAGGHSGGGISIANNGGYADIQGTHPVFGGGSITVTAWIRPTDYTNSGRILSNRVGMDGGYPTSFDFTLESNAGDPAIGFYVTEQPTLVVTSPPMINTWSHIAAVHRADGVSSVSEVWFNGVLAKSEVHERAAFQKTPRIGNDYRGVGLAFRGVIDDLRIYDRALTGTELAAQAKP